jgi:hypothetical protein
MHESIGDPHKAVARGFGDLVDGHLSPPFRR